MGTQYGDNMGTICCPHIAICMRTQYGDKFAVPILKWVPSTRRTNPKLNLRPKSLLKKGHFWAILDNRSPKNGLLVLLKHMEP